MTDPLVSISILTYKHKYLIEKAIESVLNQQVDFEYEILIGDDGSKDETVDVLKKFEAKYPDKIFVTYHPENNKGIKGRVNNMMNLQNCRGKYIAMLDGDDFWQDETKLQKTIDFLEANTDYNLVFHDMYLQCETGKQFKESFIGNYGNVRNELTSGSGTLLFSQFFKYGQSMCCTSSIVYRREKVLPFPKWFDEIAAADYAIELLAVYKSKAYFMNERLGTYYIHAKSVSSTISRETNTYQAKLKELKYYSEFFNDEYKHGMFDGVKARLAFQHGLIALKSKRIKKGFLFWKRSFLIDWKIFFSKVYEIGRNLIVRTIN